VVERGLQDLAIVVDRCVRIVEQLKREDAVPIADASRCSAKRRSWKSASAFGSSTSAWVEV
jgi:hypothetical protein